MLARLEPDGTRRMRRPALICIDIDGTLTHDVTGPVVPGAVDAVHAIAADFPVRYVTNATSRPRRVLFDALSGHGFPGGPDWLWTPATTARRILSERKHAAGLLLCEPALREDLDWFREDPDGPAVLLGGECFDRTIEQLQPAFRRLLEGGVLYTLQQNRYFRRGEELLTDLGPLAAFLEYAAGVQATLLGKPSELLFDAIAAEAAVDRNAILMIGDDVEFDVSAVVGLGMTGVLVRTGKYRPGDESAHRPEPSAVLDSIAGLPELLKRL